MSRLVHLRAQLTSLRRSRAVARWVTGYSSLAIAVLWSLLLFLAIDLLFELDVLQRLVIWLPTVLVCWWAFSRFVKPVLGVQESDADIALQVERNHGIHSDLIAAMQFEGADSATWGSAQMKGAVIDYVADLGRGLQVFAGFSRAQLMRRFVTLALTVALVVLGSISFPHHALVFLNRLALGSMHYPTRTQIQLIVINEQVVLSHQQSWRADLYNRLDDVKCAQGNAVEFYVQCKGVIPTKAEVRLSSPGTGKRRLVELTPVDLARRRQWLATAQQKLEQAIQDPSQDVEGPWFQQVRSLLSFDAPSASAEMIAGTMREAEQLQTVLGLVQQRLADWPGPAERTEVFAGSIERIVDELEYSVVVGDAWTETGHLRLIPLPAVQTRLTPTPPEYARGDESLSAPAERNLSVLVGSDVTIEMKSTNSKPLQAAWVIARTEKDVKRYHLQTAGSNLVWRLPPADTLFGKVRHEIRYEMQAVDEDGLHLESPIRGVIRLRPDRPPRGAASVIHRVVLPGATPILSFRVNDDFGIGKVLLHAQVERLDNELYAKADSDVQHKNEEQTFLLLDSDQPVTGAKLPYSNRFALALARLKLKKGDRLQLTLEVVDDRGKTAGQSFRADPLFLEISDQAGVLAAISEADETSEKQLNDVIDRQIGIGGSP